MEVSSWADGVVWQTSPPVALLTARQDWLGLPVALHALGCHADFRDIEQPVDGIGVARSGRGKRRYACGTQRGELFTAPRMIEVFEAGTYYDRFQLRGDVPGDAIVIELPAALLGRWLHDAARSFRLRTQHEVFDERVAHLANLLWDDAAGGAGLDPLFTQGLCTALIGLLSGDAWQATGPAKASGGKLSATQRSRLLDFVAAELGGHLSVDRMAALVDMSPFHFSRAFRRTFDHSPYAYVLERRLDAACALMRRKPGCTLAEVALAVGFSSQAHFTDAFRRKIGTTPTQWRRSG
ncbi:MAG TPA: AraC family transcriptional regulator [Pseudorhodoferax sp.]|nr:AraC family transcriptional regulator [Pseudorhodoferax sp.]